MNSLDTVRDYFSKLGLQAEVADLYFALHQKGPQSISELSRNSGVERTRIYRLLDELQRNALIEVEEEYKRKILKAVPVSNLQVLFSKREQELMELQSFLPSLEKILETSSIQTTSTGIQFYQGEDGIKQLLWNETKAKGEVVSILYENIQGKTAEKFFDRWVGKCNELGLHFRSIVSDSFLESQEAWYSNHVNERLKNWQARYLDSKVFNISHTSIIYDDVVAYYSWRDNEIFGIEIHNMDIANAQRELFELLWSKGRTRPDLI